ncbi:hypothetical protein [Prochlorothrix hollandica]|uniref:hypothetical protein n=1 Tax=Prochlorothrix hollandica TaxID=1223 RepID=UPI000344AD11|nr:hypothetical protein [Prochlorothrix hollandica]
MVMSFWLENQTVSKEFKDNLIQDLIAFDSGSGFSIKNYGFTGILNIINNSSDVLYECDLFELYYDSCIGDTSDFMIYEKQYSSRLEIYFDDEDVIDQDLYFDFWIWAGISTEVKNGSLGMRPYSV